MATMRRYDLLKTFATECLSVGGERILHSGVVSPYFVDAPLIFQNAFAVEGLMIQLENLLINVHDISGFISPDFGGTFFALVFQQYLLARSGQYIPVFRLNKDGKIDDLPPYSFCAYKRYVILEDVVTTAGSIMQIISHLNNTQDLASLQVLSVVNRQHGGGEQLLAGMMIPYSAVFTLDELLACRKTLGYE